MCDPETEVAYVLVIVHDSAFGNTSSVPLPTECDHHGDIHTEYKYGYSIQLPCYCDEGDVVLDSWAGHTSLFRNETSTVTIFSDGAFVPAVTPSGISTSGAVEIAKRPKKTPFSQGAQLSRDGTPAETSGETRSAAI